MYIIEKYKSKTIVSFIQLNFIFNERNFETDQFYSRGTKDH